MALTIAQIVSVSYEKVLKQIKDAEQAYESAFYSAFFKDGQAVFDDNLTDAEKLSLRLNPPEERLISDPGCDAVWKYRDIDHRCERVHGHTGSHVRFSFWGKPQYVWSASTGRRRG